METSTILFDSFLILKTFLSTISTITHYGAENSKLKRRDKLTIQEFFYNLMYCSARKAFPKIAEQKEILFAL